MLVCTSGEQQEFEGPPGAAGENTAALAAKAQCESMLGARHAAERLLRCWGAGAGLSFDATRTAIRNLLEARPAERKCCISNIMNAGITNAFQVHM